MKTKKQQLRYNLDFYEKVRLDSSFQLNIRIENKHYTVYSIWSVPPHHMILHFLQTSTPFGKKYSLNDYHSF